MSSVNRPAEVHWDPASSRLLNLVLALTERPRSLHWIRTHVDGYAGAPEIVRKRFDRDRPLLDELGLVVTESTGTDADGHPEVQYGIDPVPSFLPDLAVTDARWQAMRPAAQWVPNQSLAAPVRHALQKLSTVAPASDADAGPGFSAPVPDAVDLTDADIEALNVAMDRNLSLRFHYWPALTEEPQLRRLDPWGVAAVDGRLYLTGFDLDRDGQRTFRLSRIADLEAAATLIRHHVPDRPVAELVTEGLRAASTMVSARVRFLTDGAQELRALAGPEDAEDGDGARPLGPVDRRWLVRTAASYATDVLVVDPPDVVADIIAHLEEAVRTFGASGAGGEEERS
ncbi:WYL domain-containing protein [Corynebacterium sp.]|uniref:helix-turn-helix transcriptional regulator n=1 Tax=Corynebacterium sp. TaxID=1720 RepID=UPI0025C21CF8|nr:WYL domain-containing protein [Corynebacterium sp.]